MEDSLINPIQAEEAGAQIDLRPSRYYPSDIGCQQVRFPDGTVLPIQYDGVLPYLPVRRPTKGEVHHCRRLTMTERIPWDPFMFNGSFSAASTDINTIDMTQIMDQLDQYDPVASELMSSQLHSILALSSMIEIEENDDHVISVKYLRSKQSSSLSAS